MSSPSSQSLKRARNVSNDSSNGAKKPRRSARLSEAVQQLPSPVTGQESLDTLDTALSHHDSPSPSPALEDHEHRQRTPEISTSTDLLAMSSPGQDTQTTAVLSQFIPPSQRISDEVEDEAAEGVWGYLTPMSGTNYRTLVLKKRTACPMPDATQVAGDKENIPRNNLEAEEEAYEETKEKGVASGGYLIGRHPECGEYTLTLMSYSMLTVRSHYE